MVGTAYYPEHWEPYRIDTDIKLMADGGIEIVRLGEFMWDRLEAKENHFDFSILDKTFDVCQKHGLYIILGTPSATPPSWLGRKHPSIHQKDIYGNIRHFGSRRHYCYNSETYKRYVEIIVDKLAERYAARNNLYAFQIDNEFGCEGTTLCYCEKCGNAFREYLKERYHHRILELNRAWGTAFWSQSYNDFAQIDPPRKTNALPNPHQMLDYYRFTSRSITSFASHQIETIRRYSDKPVTHNFMVNFTDINYHQHKQLYDFISYDNYMPTERYDHHISAFNLDLMWSLHRKPFVVMEQQPGRVNWQVRNTYYPAEHLIPSTMQAYLHGASDLLYFRYRALPYGAEQYHNGILNYNGKPEQSPRLDIVKNLSKEVLMLPNRPKSSVAIYFDYEAAWMHRINNVSKDFDYLNAVIDIYSALMDAGKSIDIVFRDTDRDEYELIIVPYAFYLPNHVIIALSSSKAKLIITCMSNLKDENNHIISHHPLGWRIRELSFEIIDFGACRDEGFVHASHRLKGDHWMEQLRLNKGEVFARWNSGSLSGEPAIITSRSDDVMYVSTVLDRRDWKRLLHIWLDYQAKRPKDVEIVNTEKGSYILNYGKTIKLGNTTLQPYSCYSDNPDMLPEKVDEEAISPDEISGESKPSRHDRINIHQTYLSKEELEELTSYVDDDVYDY